jgi:hypothetical protein
MHGFYTEHRELPAGSSLSHDLAQHIYMRSAKGSVVVLTDRPHDLAAITKKQWNILIRHVQRERASTLKAARIAELSNQVAWMQDLKFIIKLPKELIDNSIVFASQEEMTTRPPVCSVLYVTKSLGNEVFGSISKNLPIDSIVIIYKP